MCDINKDIKIGTFKTMALAEIAVRFRIRHISVRVWQTEDIVGVTAMKSMATPEQSQSQALLSENACWGVENLKVECRERNW